MKSCVVMTVWFFNVQVVREAMRQAIELLCFPANSTQSLQPDDKIFNNLKNKMSATASVQRWIQPGFTVKKENFVILLHQGLLQALTTKNVKAAWESSGCYPVSKKHLDWKYIRKDENKGIQ